MLRRRIETSPNQNGFPATEGQLGGIHTGEIFDLSAIGIVKIFGGGGAVAREGNSIEIPIL
jgi:hypothetical protein